MTSAPKLNPTAQAVAYAAMLRTPGALGAIDGAIAYGLNWTELLDARAAFAELVAADREYDAARLDLDAAMRARGRWAVNPLPHTHPATVRMREAMLRRERALTAVEGVAKPLPAGIDGR
jgi:hypothetical protein